MEQAFLVLGVKRYAFEDETTHRRVEGMTVHYVDPAVYEKTENSRGSFPLTISADITLYGSLGAVPGLYDLSFRQRPGKNGRPTLALVGAELLKPFNLAEQVSSSPSLVKAAVK